MCNKAALSNTMSHHSGDTATLPGASYSADDLQSLFDNTNSFLGHTSTVTCMQQLLQERLTYSASASGQTEFVNPCLLLCDCSYKTHRCLQRHCPIFITRTLHLYTLSYLRKTCLEQCRFSSYTVQMPCYTPLESPNYINSCYN